MEKSRRAAASYTIVKRGVVRGVITDMPFSPLLSPVRESGDSTKPRRRAGAAQASGRLDDPAGDARAGVAGRLRRVVVRGGMHDQALADQVVRTGSEAHPL